MSTPMIMSDFSFLHKPQYGLVVGIPTLGAHRMEFTLSLMQTGFPINTVGQYMPVVGHRVGEARNMICFAAKQSKAKYLAFVDEDVLLPANAFRQLVWRLDNNPDISVVAGIYPTKSEPPMPLLFDAPGVGPSYDWHVGDFRKTYAIGMGCAIIRVADLEKLDDRVGSTIIDNFPTAGFNTEVKEYFKDGTAWIKDEEARGGGWALSFTEDMYFCMKCADAGLKVYADCSLQCSHIAGDGRIYILGECRPSRPLVEEGKPIYLDLGAGNMYRSWVDNVPMLRVDLDPSGHPDYVQDVRNLDFRDNTADGMSAIHVLEHMSRHDAELMLDEMCRITKPGGSIVIGCPDMKCIMEYYQKTGELDDYVLRSIFGGQTDEYQFHKSAWDIKSLTHALERRGFTVTAAGADPNVLGMNVWARKLKPGEEPVPTPSPAPAIMTPQGSTQPPSLVLAQEKAEIDAIAAESDKPADEPGKQYDFAENEAQAVGDTSEPEAKAPKAKKHKEG